MLKTAYGHVTRCFVSSHKWYHRCLCS